MKLSAKALPTRQKAEVSLNEQVILEKTLQGQTSLLWNQYVDLEYLLYLKIDECKLQYCI